MSDESEAEAANDVTIATYEATARRFREQGMVLVDPLRGFLDRFVDRVGPDAEVLELGSGPGRDARYLEERGLRVQPTDGTAAFVELMREDGHHPRLLDVRDGDFGGPYRAVFANAVLLHLSRVEFHAALVAARRAVVAGGVLGLTLKEGDGEGWTTERLDLPRWFVYWREAELREALAGAGWIVESLEHVIGHYDPWIHVIARADAAPISRPDRER